MDCALLLRQGLGEDMFVQAVGLSYPAAQIYPFYGSLEVPFGDIDKKLRGNR